MDNLARKNKKYNYEDLEKIRDNNNNRYELINGDLYLMSSPRGIHQMILLEIGRQLSEFFEGKKCRPFVAPFDYPGFDMSDDRIFEECSTTSHRK